jgi:hypothetical protein
MRHKEVHLGVLIQLLKLCNIFADGGSLYGAPSSYHTLPDFSHNVLFRFYQMQHNLTKCKLILQKLLLSLYLLEKYKGLSTSKAGGTNSG